MKIWICMQYKENGFGEFQGAYSTKEKAIAACREWEYGIGPCDLDQEIPHDTTEWEGFYYPKAKET